MMESLDSQGQDVLQRQLATRELHHWIVWIALLRQDLLIYILSRNFSVYNQPKSKSRLRHQ